MTQCAHAVNSHAERRMNASLTKFVSLMTSLMFAVLFLFTGLTAPTSTWADQATSDTDPTSFVPTDELSPEGFFRITFIDVGQGDSALLWLPDGSLMLVDAGTTQTGQAVVDYLTAIGTQSIDHLVATHPHEDHIGGMPAVLQNFPVFNVWAPEVAADTKTFENFLDAVDSQGLSINVAVAGTRIYEACGCTVDVLSPVDGTSYDDLNDWSVVLLVRFGTQSFLLTGDASYAITSELGLGHIDVLKVSHHGSDTGTTPELVAALSPTLSVISVGADNKYGHPTQETLDELATSTVWRTDLDSTVLVESDGWSTWSYALSGAQTPKSAEQAAAEAEAAVAAQEEALAAQQAQAQAEAEAAAAAVAQADNQNTSGTVYITKTGEKYHADGCSSLRKSKIAIDLSSAKAQGYEACKKCNPPS